MPATPQYDVVLDDQGYLIDPETYRASLATPFAPKTRTGDAGFGDLAGGSAWAQASYRGGFGYLEWDAEHPDRFADGTRIDISYGDVRLGRRLTAAGPSLGKFAQYRGLLYGIENGQTKVYSSADGSTWSLSVDIATVTGGSDVTSLRSIWVIAGYLCVGSGNNGKVFQFSGTTWTLMLSFGAATAVTAGTQGRFSPGGSGSLTHWIAFQGTGLGGSSSPYECMLAEYDLGGTLTTTVVMPYQRVEALHVPPEGGVFVGACSDSAAPSIEGGVFYVSGAAGAVQVLIIHRFFDNAITAFGPYKDKLLAGSRQNGVVWEVDRTGVETFFVMPEHAMAGTPPTYPYAIRGMCIDNDRLYVPFIDVIDDPANYTLAYPCLYQFDGQGWCRFATALAEAIDTVGPPEPGEVVTFSDALLVGSTRPGGTTGAAVTRAPRIYAALGTLITSWFDADLPGVDKAPGEITITHTPLLANQSVTVDYATDYETGWHTLGVSDVDGAMEAVFTLPTLTCDRIRFRYTLAGPVGATTSVKLRSGVMSYQLLPDVKHEWRFATLLAGYPGGGELIRYDNTPEPRTASELSNALWASKAEKAQRVFVDIDGSMYAVWFDELVEEIDHSRGRGELATRGLVRLVEA